MKMEIKRDSIRIQPTEEIDEAYIEKVLGLFEEGDLCVVERVAPSGMQREIAYLKVRRAESGDVV